MNPRCAYNCLICFMDAVKVGILALVIYSAVVKFIWRDFVTKKRNLLTVVTSAVNVTFWYLYIIDTGIDTYSKLTCWVSRRTVFFFKQSKLFPYMSSAVPISIVCKGQF